MKKLIIKIILVVFLVGLALFLFFKYQDHFLKNKKDYFSIKRSRAEQQLANLDQLYTTILIIPYYENGKPEGFKIVSVKTGSFFHELGFKRGDILKTINGIPLDIKTGFVIFNQLKNKKEFYIELERKGELKRLDYKIVE